MAVEFKTLTFPNTEEGRREKNSKIQWYANQGWEVVSENIKQGEFRGGRACCLFLICTPCAFLAGSTDGEIIVTLKRDPSKDNTTNNTPSQSSSVTTTADRNSLSPSSSQYTKQDTKLTSTPEKKYEPVLGFETNSLIKRAFIFLEDGEFDNAGRYLNQALNQDAENSRVYLGLLLLAYKAHNTAELIDKLSKPIEEEKSFQRALRFADDDYKQQLENIAQSVKDKLEQERLAKEAELERKKAEEEAKKEKAYQEILSLKEKASTISDYKVILSRASLIRSYKDTEQIYQETKETFATETKYQEAIEKKNSAKKPEEWQIVMTTFSELGNYKDAEELYKQAQEALDLSIRTQKRKKIIIAASSIVLIIAAILAKPFVYYQIGKLYEEGRYVEKNLDKAKEWYKTTGWHGGWVYDSSNWDDFYSQSSKAKAYFAFLRIDAEQGNTDAQKNLAEAYYYARGVERNYSKAAEWYLRAAQQGNTYSQYHLAQMYEEGEGVEKNIDEAIKWYQKAANLNDQSAKLALGRLYEEGKDVERNLDEARKWYQMVIGKDYYIEARKGLERINRLEQEEKDKLIRYQKLAESGDVEAQNYLRDLQEKQKAKEEQERKAKELEEQKAREEQRAREEAAEKKRAEAERTFSSAEINEANGNLETALSLFRQALELGHPKAQNRITALQEKINARDNEADDEAYTRAVQYLDEKNYSQAIDIFRKLANNDYAPAQDKLAWMYQNGWGVEQSYSQAVSWFRKAAEQGNTEAMASMGLMYYRGWGVERDYDTSLEWYGKAARQGSEVAQRRINSIQTLKANKQKIASIERNDDFPIPGTITAETLSVRQSPNTNSTRIKTLRTGHPVSVSKATESDNDYWLYVRTASGTEGWVLGGYVKLIDRNLSYEETNNRRRSLPKSGYVATHNDTLNLRNIPAVKGSQVIEKLDSGTSFTAYEVFAGDTVDWYRIRTNYGDEGWVSGKYIELQY